MDSNLDIHTAAAPPEVLTRLARYGRDWRDSKIESALQAQGVMGCSIAVRDNTFVLRLAFSQLFHPWRWRRGFRFAAHGIVEADATGQGSRLRARVLQTPVSRASWAVQPFLFVLLWVLVNGGLVHVLALAVVGIGLVVVGVAVFLRERTDQTALMRTALEGVLRAAPRSQPAA